MTAPLLLAVVNHADAEDVRALLAAQGANVLVVPYGASVLTYAGRDTERAAGAIFIAPKPGGPITRAQFIAWIDTSVLPYIAPGTLRVYL